VTKDADLSASKAKKATQLVAAEAGERRRLIQQRHEAADAARALVENMKVGWCRFDPMLTALGFSAFEA